jgi:hypothetical protein
MSASLVVIPAKAGTHLSGLRSATFVSIAKWIPAFAGLTE